MGKFLERIDLILRKIVACTMGLMLGVIFFQVVNRYVFHHTFGFTEELARYLFVWSVFLGLPIVSREGSHMVVGIFTSRLKGTSQFVFQVLAFSVSILFLGLIVVYGIQMINMMTFQHSPGLGIQMSWVYLALPIGAGIMILDILEKLVSLIKTRSTYF